MIKDLEAGKQHMERVVEHQDVEKGNAFEGDNMVESRSLES